MDRVDDLLDDLVRRNADVQRELRALRKEILDLRAAGSKNPDLGPSQAVPGPPQKPGATDLAPVAAGPSPPASTREAVDGKRTVTQSGATPDYFELGDRMMVASPRGERVAMFNRVTGANNCFLFAVPDGARYQIEPACFNNEMVALRVTGPKINRIAVYVVLDDGTERWYPQDLREPVASATPVLGNGCVAYVQGRRVYAFSSTTKSWDVLELDLAPGVSPRLEQDNDLLTFKVRFLSHVYTFSDRSEKWKDLDLNAILDGKQPFEKEDPQPRSRGPFEQDDPQPPSKLKVDSE